MIRAIDLNGIFEFTSFIFLLRPKPDVIHPRSQYQRSHDWNTSSPTHRPVFIPFPILLPGGVIFYSFISPSPFDLHGNPKS